MISLPEVTSMGIYNSKIAARNIAVSEERRTTGFELDLALEEGGISYINGQSHPITQNLLICAKPGQIRHTQFPFRCSYVHLRVAEGALYELLMGLPAFIITEQREVYAALFKKLIQCQNNGRAADAVLLHSLLMELIYTLHFESSATHRRNRSGNTMIDVALAHIQEHLTEDLRLETVAAVVHLSPIHFHNKFKAAVGTTLRDYVEEQRIKKAIDLLLTTDRSVTEIALTCGFSSQSYFSSVFKRRLKKTPREYVQELNSRYEI